MPIKLPTERLAAPSMPKPPPSMWLIVFARGRGPVFMDDPMLLVEFLRTRLALPEMLLVLSRRLRGREEGVVVMCSFCWCRKSRSRRAKHLVHSGHSNGFSFVCDRSWRFRCSNRAKERLQVVQTCGLGLSVLTGKLGFGC